jgi:hypothetical protein
VLAIDQGTTSTRSIIFNTSARAVSITRRDLEQYYPAAGWVEHDAEEIWRATLATAREAIEAAKLGGDDIAAIGITNQRETALIWAASENHAEVVTLLAKNGADLNAKSNTLTFPLAKYGDGKSARFTVLPRGGWTPLMYAARQGATNAARALAETGANLNLSFLTHQVWGNPAGNTFHPVFPGLNPCGSCL